MISGILTAVFLVVFMAIGWWAYSERNRERWNAAARLPLDEQGISAKQHECCCGSATHAQRTPNRE